MNTDMKAKVINLLESYAMRERQIALLHYEMQHPPCISPEEMVAEMSFGHNDGLGGNKGRVSDKTMYIALNYRERMDRMNAEAMSEVAQRLLGLETEQDRIRYYVSLLEKRESKVIRSFYMEGCSWEEIAQEIGVALRTVHKIKNRGIEQLAELYAYKSNLIERAQ